MVDGWVMRVSPAAPPHADRQVAIGYVLNATVAPDYVASSELLTRVSEDSDFATDVCIRKADEDAEGHRHLEELSFEIKHTQSESDIKKRARYLTRRGVRRVLAVYVRVKERDGEEQVIAGPVKEWSVEKDDWNELAAQIAHQSQPGRAHLCDLTEVESLYRARLYTLEIKRDSSIPPEIQPISIHHTRDIWNLARLIYSRLDDDQEHFVVLLCDAVQALITRNRARRHHQLVHENFEEAIRGARGDTDCDLVVRAQAELGSRGDLLAIQEEQEGLLGGDQLDAVPGIWRQPRRGIRFDHAHGQPRSDPLAEDERLLRPAPAQRDDIDPIGRLAGGRPEIAAHVHLLSESRWNRRGEQRRNIARRRGPDLQRNVASIAGFRGLSDIAVAALHRPSAQEVGLEAATYERVVTELVANRSSEGRAGWLVLPVLPVFHGLEADPAASDHGDRYQHRSNSSHRVEALAFLVPTLTPRSLLIIRADPSSPLPGGWWLRPQSGRSTPHRAGPPWALRHIHRERRIGSPRRDELERSTRIAATWLKGPSAWR